MDITRNSYAQWEVKMIQSLLIATQFLLQRGRGTSEAGGGARDAGSLGALLERRLVEGLVWAVGADRVGELDRAPPPSFGWSPSPFRGGIQ